MKTESKMLKILQSNLVMFVIALVMLAFAGGCGSGGGGGGSGTGASSDAGTAPVLKEGTFIDSVVEGMEYETDTQSGATDGEGTFTYYEGEIVTFFIGDVVLGEAMAKPTMTPIDLVDEAVDETHPTVVNICRFLQSLDVDGNIDDSINISAEIRDALTGQPPVDFNQTVENFTNDPGVQALFDTLNALNVFDTGDRELCDAAQAADHLRKCLWHRENIIVRSPNGRELLVAGGSFEITWNTSSSIGNVTILLSQDSGRNYTTTIVLSTPNDGSYTWDLIPSDLAGSDNRIRILNTDNTSCYDNSNRDFTILEEMQSSIVVFTPNGGEEWIAGTSREIIWSAIPTITTVKIELSLDAGQTFIHEIAESTPNDGVYIWGPIPVAAVGDFNRIRISDADDVTVYAQSASSFTIKSPTIHAESPDGGEQWEAGANGEIIWEASPTIEDVEILLSEDGGQTYPTVIVDSTPNDGRYVWTSITIAEGSSYRVRIEDAVTAVYDDSDSDFSVFTAGGSPVEGPSIQVISPNGGETWLPGTSEEITWNCISTIDNVRIELSMDSGQTFSYVIAESTPNDGVYIWESIPVEFTGQFNRIRISDADDPDQADPTVFDVSDASFTIPAVILVVSPNGGEEWQTGTSQEITWNASPTIENVTILLLSQEAGGVWDETLIAISTPNNGSYTWPSIPSWAVGLNKRIRVTDAGHPAVYDDSNNDFAIQLDRPTLGSLWQDLQASLQDPPVSDSDGDGLTDDFEVYLGTNPNDQDTDGDGLYDFGEIFGNGVFNGQDLIPDDDGDGIYAVFDPDDDNDGVNDGEFVDTDNDGIPNYLEIYGYTYNWMSGRFLPWDEEDVKNDPSVPYYKSDPLQPSTDQDPYSDSMEVSGAFMDVTVEPPGDLPMVPAYPDIVVKLERYEVTLNADITTSTGTSLAKGDTWNTDTYDTHTHTDESNWEVGLEVSAKFGISGGTEVKASYTHGESEADSTTTGTVKSSGGSSLTTEDWSTGRSWNPTEAAHIKLYFKFYNYGTAAANNIIPTLTLRIGGKNIATFEPGNSQINLLEPGGVYPTVPGAYWVVDSIDTGAGVVDISLTMDELRALETGAPVSVVLTQMTADVLRMTEDGVWEIVGDWNAYMSRYNAVCSNLLMDIGDGNAINYLVYSDNSSSAPKVTLRDALLWVAGGAEEGDQQLIRYYDRVNGGVGERDLAGWDFAVDRATWDASKPLWDADEDGQVDDGFNLFDLVLGPNSKITGRAPHPGDPAEGRPKIHYAYFDEANSVIRAYVSDYYGVKSVELFLEHPDSPFTMHEEYYEGSGYYSIKIDPGYAWKETEKIRAANVKAYESDPPNEDFITESDVLPVYSGPVDVLQTPFIRWVRLNHNELMLTAEVQPRGGVPIQSVYLDFVGTSEEDIELEPLPGYENVWTCRLPDGYHTPDYPELVVAVNDHGFSASSAVTDRVNVRAAGTVTLYYIQQTVNCSQYSGEYVNGFALREVQTLDKLMKNDWSDGSLNDTWGHSYNPDWHVTADLITYPGGYDCAYWNSNPRVWIHWQAPTPPPTETIGLEVTQGEWAGLTRENLALMKPVMQDYGGSGWNSAYHDNMTSSVGYSFVTYHAPYFVKATVEKVEFTDPIVGSNKRDYTVSVDVKYVVFANANESWIRLESPDSSDSLTGCQDFDITWETGGDVQNVRLELWRTSGAGPGVNFCRVIEESTPNDGTYTWRVPNRGDEMYWEWQSKEQYKYKVRISDVTNDSALFDFSDLFDIYLNPDEPWILVAKDATYAQDVDNDDDPDILHFYWLHDDDDGLPEERMLKLRLEAEHDTDSSKNFTIEQEIPFKNQYNFSPGTDVLEDREFTYRFTIEEAANPEVFEVDGPFKISETPSDNPYVPGYVLWWPVFQ